jgi:hypothetical protein
MRLEGFQAATPATCPPSANTSFPIRMDTDINSANYDSIEDTVSIDIKWSTRTTAPVITTDGKTDDVGTGTSNITTLRYNSSNYNLVSVQICKATHKSWLETPERRTLNKADVVLTFENVNTSRDNRYILLIAPLCMTEIDTVSNPSKYIQGLYEQSESNPLSSLFGGGSGQEYSLRTVFPPENTTRFVYYSTCLTGNTQNPGTQTSLVFINTVGINLSKTMSTSLLEKLGRELKRQSGQTSEVYVKAYDDLPAFEPPFTTRLQPVSSSIKNLEDLKRRCNTTKQLLNYASYKATLNARQDSTDAYKCVPLDPDVDIRDGKLTVDTANGQLLTELNAQRQALMGEVTGGIPGWFTSGFEANFGSTAMGIIVILISIGIIGGIIYGVMLKPKPIASIAGSSTAAVAAAAAAGTGGAAAGGPLGTPPGGIGAPAETTPIRQLLASKWAWLVFVLFGIFCFLIGLVIMAEIIL